MRSLTARIFWSIFLTTMAVVVLTGALGSVLVYAMLDGQLRRELQNTAELVVQALPTTTNEAAYLESLAVRDTRITWIAPNGTVLYDSVVMREEAGDGSAPTAGDVTVGDGSALTAGDGPAPPPEGSLDNHLDRPEVQDALATGSGTASRHSQTLDEE
ncbi:MAG: hypothetical protein LBS58_02020, partial [Coriobacteriales bacterium]|nr:hypothetical protein [Coriobacteriales bacterium]